VSDFGSDDPDNGILLRADLHRLFDGRLVSIAHDTSRVLFADEVRHSRHYRVFKGRTASLTSGQRQRLARRNRSLESAGIKLRP
jgi:hypothetical protein